MKRSLTLMIILGLVGAIQAGQPSAQDIVAKSDSVINAPKDQKAIMTMILIDKKGNRKRREAVFMQKGDDRRILRFTKPADQKGIAFLALPGDVQYLYMPAFHKVRRIASHIKNTKFAGTDFTYDDMSTSRLAENYNARLLQEDDQFWILKLVPKPGVKKDYGHLKLWVRKDNYYQVKIEFYDRAGNLWKVMERRQVVKIGKYWYAREMEMRDLKEEHATIMQSKDVQFDLGLSNKLFTRRYLRRAK
ncbi:MAG: outer membrane lipoprotein-sorting protein [candidate division KSB1 bacterium]|nr:outer membrane lipoprotein-sorting protein [candidate division KSB1 bacterium]MDQ7063880.1 outer membrane lipoprotein-sorting protein [candidate division KSB1 bacterium]